MQGGAFAAKAIRATLEGRGREKLRKFRYVDKGIMATIGRSRAVAEPFGVKLSGFIAWLAWLVVHIWYLIGFRNRVIVMFEWFWAYATYKRGARLITSGDVPRGEIERGRREASAATSRTSRP